MSVNVSEVVATMGLKTRSPQLYLAEKVGSGLPASVLSSVARKVAPGTAESTLWKGLIPPATLSRQKKAGKLSAAQSDKVYDVTRVWVAVKAFFHGDEDKARRFLSRPHPLLRGKTPWELLKNSSAGADLVIDVVMRGRAGVAP